MEILNSGEKHVACVLAVDVSASMELGGKIDQLNEGLRAFGRAIQDDSYAQGCVDVAVISFSNDVKVVSEFQPAADFIPPVLETESMTSLNAAIIQALDMICARKEEYKTNGVDYFRPWLFLLTDGWATDVENESAALDNLNDDSDNSRVLFFPMAIGEGVERDMSVEKLKKYTQNGDGKVLSASEKDFKDAFKWLANSLVQVSHSNASQETLELNPLPRSITIHL